KGTFIFSSITFLLWKLLLSYSFVQQHNVKDFYLFLVFSGPILLYFCYWFNLIVKNENKADFEHSMRMNIISSICLSAAFFSMMIF
ncbi:hypothetical protein N9B55_02100, partial [Vicingaceae bacterium]|nr:hypothetical protein [Vicingaceae bacterium]